MGEAPSTNATTGNAGQAAELAGEVASAADQPGDMTGCGAGDADQPSGMADDEASTADEPTDVAGGETTDFGDCGRLILESNLSSDVVSSGLDTCSVDLDVPDLTPETNLSEMLHLIVEQDGVSYEVARDLGDGEGWTITADGTRVDLLGAVCQAAMDGQYDGITFALGCVDLPPLPPPIPPCD